MAYSITDRLVHAWNAFISRDPTHYRTSEAYWGTSATVGRPGRQYTYVSSDQSIITMIEERIAIDVAQVDIRHVRKDENNNFKEDVDSYLNEALTISANRDQTGRAFIKDLVMSMFDEGVVAVVPIEIETDYDPEDSDAYDVISLRTGRVVEYYPKHVKLEVFNEDKLRKETIILPKKMVAIIENPFYSIMNEPNSTLKRLVKTLRNLDITNEANASGKLDIIIQLPYSLKSPLKQQQAESRRRQIEKQLVGSKYGIAYTDATERITQLNRPSENNLWKEAQDLTSMLYNQLGLTQSVFDGTANEATMTNYYNRTIEPILAAITEEMSRKFLSKNARTRKQDIMYIRDPFKLITVTDIAQIAQTFTANEIMSSNEIRAKVGLKPVDDPRADELINKQINKIDEGGERASTEDVPPEENQNEGDLNE